MAMLVESDSEDNSDLEEFHYYSLHLLRKQYLKPQHSAAQLDPRCHTTNLKNHFEDTHQTFELSISIMLSSSCIQTKAFHSSSKLFSKA
ncbi:hypothetical protein MJO29_014667 [Puccinia striiformis f. sp. tritici]|nr:hypothetical protein MJO29_014667 [Puccinia striiformis f. sp. tritici]